MAIEWKERPTGMLVAYCEDLTLEAFHYDTGFRATVSVAEVEIFDAGDYPTLDAAKLAAETFAREWIAAQAAALGLSVKPIATPVVIGDDAISKGQASALGDGWISVEERLPEDDRNVLCLATDGFGIRKPHIGWYAPDRSPQWSTYDLWTVTHWRPLPPLPETK